MVERVVRITDLHDDALPAKDLAYWLSRPSSERIAELERLRREYDGIPAAGASQDFRGWLECLTVTKTEFVVVGGYALAHHGCPRFTGDIDVFVRPTEENAARVLEALRRFGFGSLDIGLADLSNPGRVVQLGFPPQRIDILTSIDGLDWSEASRSPSIDRSAGIEIPYISRDALLRHKRASGRLEDLADAEALEGRAGRAP